jgi:hypothetical protein
MSSYSSDNKMLEIFLEKKKEEWYYWRLMELYIEEGCSLTKLSKRTTIPLNSVSRDIHKIKKILIPTVLSSSIII